MLVLNLVDLGPTRAEVTQEASSCHASHDRRLQADWRVPHMRRVSDQTHTHAVAMRTRSPIAMWVRACVRVCVCVCGVHVLQHLPVHPDANVSMLKNRSHRHGLQPLRRAGEC